MEKELKNKIKKEIRKMYWQQGMSLDVILAHIRQTYGEDGVNIFKDMIKYAELQNEED